MVKRWIASLDGWPEKKVGQVEVVKASDYDLAIAALRALMTNPHINLGDQVYEVREHEGEGWDGPSVKAWSAAVKAATEVLRGADNGGTGHAD